MLRTEIKDIRKTPGVNGGVACVRDTRIAVWTLIDLLKQGRPESELLQDFPSLLSSDLDAVWDYYRINTAEIERDIAEQNIEN